MKLNTAARVALPLALLLGLSTHALAQSTVRPEAVIVSACGTAPNSGYAVIGDQKFLVMDVNGNLCVNVTVTATATTTATASATPTTVSAGAGAALNIDLHSSMFVQPTFAGTPVDSTHGLPVQGTAGGVPLPVSQANGDPCASVAHVFSNINIASGTTTKIVAGTSGKKTYICHQLMVSAAADNVAIVEGTGTNCGTSTVGMSGGTTAATGWNFQTGGGLSEGNGTNAVLATATAGDDVCLITSGAVQLSGHMVTAQQ